MNGRRLDVYDDVIHLRINIAHVVFVYIQHLSCLNIVIYFRSMLFILHIQMRPPLLLNITIEL